MKLILKTCLAALAAFAGTPGTAVTIDFDTYRAWQQVTVQTGFDFTNFYIADTASYSESGFATGAVSGAMVAFNGGGGAATIWSPRPFSIISADLTAGWRDDLDVQISGSLRGTPVFMETATLITAGPVFHSFDHGMVDTVRFTATGGRYAGFAGFGSQFIIDNLTLDRTPSEVVSGVPDPSVWSLLLSGFGLLGMGLRWRAPRQLEPSQNWEADGSMINGQLYAWSTRKR